MNSNPSQTPNNNLNDWFNNPAFAMMDPVKVELLKTALLKTQGKTGKDLVPIMLALITSANQKGIRFETNEITLILGLLKEGKTEEEQAQIDRTVQMVQRFLK